MPPVVPRYDSPQVAPAGIPNARVSTSAPIEAFGGGQAAQGLANATQGVANNAFDLAQAEKKKADDLSFLEADMKASQLQTEIELGVKDRLGKDAAGSADYAKDEWQKKSSEIRESLPNDDVKAAYDRASMVRYGNINKTVQVHTDGELTKYETDLTKSYISNARDEAVINYGDPERVSLALFQQQAALTKLFDKKGINPNDDIAKKAMSEEISKTHAGVIEAMLADGKDQMASNYLKANKDSITDAETRTRIDKAVNDGSLLGEAQRNSDRIVAKSTGMSEALKEAAKISDPKARAETEKLIEHKYAIDKAARAERQDSIYKQIGTMAETENDIAKIHRDPNWNELTIAEKNAVDKRVADRISGANVQTDRAIYNDIAHIATSDRKKFLQLNLTSPELKYKLSDADFKKFVDMQTEAKKGKENQLDGFESDENVVKSIMTQAGLDVSDKNEKRQSSAFKVKDSIDKAVAIESQRLGRKLTNEEIRKISKQQTVEVITDKGWFSDTKKKIGELDPGEAIEIPEADAAQITQALKRRGIPATEENISEMYLEGLKSGR